MRETFLLSGRSFSVNAMTYATKKFKTTECREWEASVLHQLNSTENIAKLQNLRNFFDPKRHSYAVSITVVYPTSHFYTKQNLISAHTHDVSNVEKPLIDLFFLPKYYNQRDPYGAPNLNVDDKYVTRLFSCKKVGDDYGVKVSIKILNR